MKATDHIILEDALRSALMVQRIIVQGFVDQKIEGRRLDDIAVATNRLVETLKNLTQS